MPVLVGGDWLTIPGSELLGRLDVLDYMDMQSADACVTEIGNGAGRGALADGYTLHMGNAPGATVAGGLRVGSTNDLYGVLVVDQLDAARSQGSAIAGPADVSAWAGQQAALLVAADAASERHALAVLELGADPGELPFARTAEGTLSSEQLVAWIAARLYVTIVDVEDQLSDARDHTFVPPLAETELAPDVIDLPERRVRTIHARQLRGSEPTSAHEHLQRLAGRAWECEPDEIVELDERSWDAVKVVGADDVEVEVRRWSRPAMRLPIQ
jgi:hypothetical protein